MKRAAERQEAREKQQQQEYDKDEENNKEDDPADGETGVLHDQGQDDIDMIANASSASNSGSSAPSAAMR